MSADSDLIDLLKLKLLTDTKKKLKADHEKLRLRNMDHLYAEELSVMKTEVNFITDQLKQICNEIYQAKHQLSLVDICATSEQIKIKAQIADVNKHKKEFDEIFSKVHQENETRKKEFKASIDNEQELKRQQEKSISEKEGQLLCEAAAVEKDCEDIERECAVLKKRNNAIMLKLRRKLIETENIRKQLKSRTCD